MVGSPHESTTAEAQRRRGTHRVRSGRSFLDGQLAYAHHIETMTQTILAALLPIIFVVALGLLAARFGVIQKSAAPQFAAFVVRFALPIALFAGVLKISRAQLVNGHFIVGMLLGLMIPYAITIAIGRLAFRHTSSESALQALTSAYPSMAYSGLPVLEAVVGPAGVLAVVIGNLVTSLVMLPVSLTLIEIGQRGSVEGNLASVVGRGVVDSVKQPLVWLPLTGVALALAGVHVPSVFALSFNLIGTSAAGVALFTMGVMLWGQRPRLDRDIAVNVLMKNIGQPALMLGLTVVLGIHDALGKELFLTGAIPTATSVSMLAVRYRTYSDEAVESTLVSTVGSIVTIALAIIVAEQLR